MPANQPQPTRSAEEECTSNLAAITARGSKHGINGLRMFLMMFPEWENARKMKRTPLFAAHQRLGGKLIEFGGWEMPVQYTSITDEHLAVRKAAGLFDISHMGEVLISGAGAEAFSIRRSPTTSASWRSARDNTR